MSPDITLQFVQMLVLGELQWDGGGPTSGGWTEENCHTWVTSLNTQPSVCVWEREIIVNEHKAIEMSIFFAYPS